MFKTDKFMFLLLTKFRPTQCKTNFWRDSLFFSEAELWSKSSWKPSAVEEEVAALTSRQTVKED